MATPKKKPHEKKRGGRKTAWETIIKPHLDEIVEQYANGATLEQIGAYWHVSHEAINQTKNKFPEFAEALTHARMRQEQELVGALWKLATGRAERKEISGKEGDANPFRKIVKLEPDRAAAIMLLKQHHGWSDNPKVDDAIVNALSSDEQRKHACEILNIPNTGDKSQ